LVVQPSKAFAEARFPSVGREAAGAGRARGKGARRGRGRLSPRRRARAGARPGRQV